MSHQSLVPQISSAKLVNNFDISFALSTLWDRLKEPLEIEELIQRFRANIVISAPESFEEEEWAEISIGALQFQVWPFLSWLCPSVSQSILIPGDKPIFTRLWFLNQRIWASHFVQVKFVMCIKKKSDVSHDKHTSIYLRGFAIFLHTSIEFHNS